MSKQSLCDYLSERREMALLKFSIDTKKNEILNCQQKLSEKKQKYESEKASFEQEAAGFEQLLKDDDKATIEAIVR